MLSKADDEERIPDAVPPPSRGGRNHHGLTGRLRNTLARCTKTVPEGNVLTRWGLALSEKQIPQIVENIERQHTEWSCWNTGSCLEGRRSFQLSYGRILG